MLRKQRVATATAITAFWLIMVGIFLYREGWFAPAVEAPASLQTFKPQDQWMGIYLTEGNRVGHLHLQSFEMAREGIPGYRYVLDVHLETALFGLAAMMDVNGTAWTSKEADQAEFNFTLTSGEYRMGVEGSLADDQIRGTLRTGGEEIPLLLPANGALFPGGSLGMPGTGMPVLAPGESATVQAFDPVTMKLVDATIACVGEETMTAGGEEYTTRVYTTTIGAISSKAWVTLDDEVVQATTPFGFTLRKIDPATLDDPVPANQQGDMVAAVAIFPTGKDVQIGATRLRVRISGINLDSVPNDPPWQTRDGDIVEIRQPAPLPNAATGDSPPVADFDTSPYLVSDPFVTAAHPKIIAKAQAIVGNETDPWKQTVLLYEWIYDNVEKIPVLSVPNALDVLRTEQGDCNEHTVFFTALARSLGIPCRIAIGVVYSDTLGGFGYHAWPEVYYGMWYPIDPTLGQLAADATHIKLFNGTIETWVQLVGFVGQMALEVIEVEQA